jgi:DNA polymerase-1
VIHGFFKGLLYTATQVGALPTDTICVWDGGRSAVRREIYPQYKERKPKETDQEELLSFSQQCGAIRAALKSLGMRSIYVLGVEADDVISILAHLGTDVVSIFSGDKDFHQLASKRISIFDPRQDRLYLSDVLSEWQVDTTDQILWMRAIIGDSSDNIVGVPKVGRKRAHCVVLGDSDYRTTGKAQRWQEVCKQHQDIILRNIQLMKLPKTLQESFYNEDQAQQVMSQYVACPERRWDKFVEFCQEWELSELLSTFSW